jgi:type VI protein secretion system component VasF
MFDQDFIIPTTEGALDNILYTNSSYLWWMMLLFLLATLVVIYLLLDARARRIKKSLQKSNTEEAEADTGKTKES